MKSILPLILPSIVMLGAFLLAWTFPAPFAAPPEHKDHSITCPVDAADLLLGALTCVPEAVLPA